MTEYHKPVMLRQCLEALAIRPEGIYVDVTFGGGGHSRAIVDQLTTGHLYAFDQDEDALANTEGIDSDKFTLINANFRHMKRFLKFHKVEMVDGILADLGISSHQIDEPSRGFSTRFDGPLDMRMDVSGKQTAANVLNTYSEKDLHRIFGMYGEVKNAKTLAAAIVQSRIGNPFSTIESFKKTIGHLMPRGKENKYLAQVFQALRIEVNNELEALKEFLQQTADVLKPGGRLVVMSYHSLEDRLVKTFISTGKFSGEAEKDVYGNMNRPFEPINRKVIEADEDELNENRRARSARLRIALRIENQYNKH